MEEDEEPIFAAELLKLAGPQDGKKRSFWTSTSWKKRYILLKREGNVPFLVMYDQQPKNNNDKPKEKISLYPSYHVEKHYEYRGKSFVVEFYTPDKRLTLATDDEKIFHLFVFFVQSQTKLKEDLEDECFVVRPDNSECQRRVGARGSMCLLHVSPWGVTLALQLSKCVLGQWALKCIRTYESSGKGQFSLDVGSRSPMGEGTYVFNTRIGQDNSIYDRLDGYVLAAARNRSSTPRGSSSSLSSLDIDFGHLQALTIVSADVRFTNHLKKISREIYDHLWQHLGTDLSHYNKSRGASSEVGSTLPPQKLPSVDRSVSMPTPEVITRTQVKTSQSLHGRNTRARSNPYHTMDGASPKSPPGSLDISATWHKGPSRQDSSHSTSKKVSSPPGDNLSQSPSLESQYLHMGSPSSVGSGYMSTSRQSSQTTSSSYEAAKNSDYLLAGATPAVTPPGELLCEDGSFAGTPPILRRTTDKTRTRLRSKSMDDVAEYMTMSSENLSGENEAAKMDTDEPQKYVYSYASSKQIMNMCTLPRSATSPTLENGDVKSVSHYTLEKRKKEHLRASAKNQGLRKSLSNPNMLDGPPGSLRKSGGSSSDRIHPHSPPVQTINPWILSQVNSSPIQKRSKPEVKPLELKQVLPPHLRPIHVRGGSEPSGYHYSVKDAGHDIGRRSPGSDRGHRTHRSPVGGHDDTAWHQKLQQTSPPSSLTTQSAPTQINFVNDGYTGSNTPPGNSIPTAKAWSSKENFIQQEPPFSFTSSSHQSKQLSQTVRPSPASQYPISRVHKSSNDNFTSGYHDNKGFNLTNEQINEDRRLRSPSDENGKMGIPSRSQRQSKSPKDNNRGFRSLTKDSKSPRLSGESNHEQHKIGKGHRLSNEPVSPTHRIAPNISRSSGELPSNTSLPMTPPLIHSSDSSISSLSSRELPSPTTRSIGGFQSLPQASPQPAIKDGMHIDVNAISMTGETRVFRRQKTLSPDAPSSPSPSSASETEIIVGSSHFFISQQELSGQGNPMQGRKLPGVPLDSSMSETPC